MPISKEKLAELYANKRTKGVYEAKLSIFLESDEPGVDPAEDWPLEFTTIDPESKERKPKNATTLYQGFRNAAEKLGVLFSAENPEGVIDVVQRDGSVFVIHTKRAAVVMGTSLNSDEEVEVETENSAEPQVVAA